MPVLSVGLPVYNGARWIEETIESVLQQSFADFELIISDNASTDNTAAICRAAAERDPRIRYCRNERNIGVYANFDRVFELSSGKYFKWAACSDICLQGFFEKCVAVLDARADVVLAYPRTVLLLTRPNGTAYSQDYDDYLYLQQDRPSDRFIAYLARVRLNNVMHGIFRSSALRQTSLNRPIPGSDISMVAELALRGKCVEVPERLFVRRFDSQTSSLLMNAAMAARRGLPGAPTNLQRMRLHSLRFVTTARAPIGASEKLRVWLYLLRRVASLRRQVVRKLARAASLRR